MKWFVAVLCCLMLLTPSLYADETGAVTVTLQVTDADSQQWQNGTYQFHYILSNAPAAPSASAALSGTGGATVSITKGKTVKFTVCPLADSACYTKTVAIGTDNTQTVTLTPPAIRIAGKRLTPATRLYADGEVVAPITRGAQYYNTVSNVERIWSGSAWGTVNSGAATDTAVVHKTGDETIAGIKTFSSAPVVVDSPAVKDSAVAHNTGDETIAGIKTFSSPPVLATHTPSAANDACTAGTFAWDADYVYVCTASGAWKRAAIATWP